MNRKVDRRRPLEPHDQRVVVLGPVTQMALDWLLDRRRDVLEACDDEMWAPAISPGGLRVAEYRRISGSVWAAMSLTHTVAFALSRPLPDHGALGRQLALETASLRPREAAVCLAIAESHMTMFEILDRRGDVLAAADLCAGGDEVEVFVGASAKGLKQGDLVAGRVITVEGRTSFHAPTLRLTERTARFAADLLLEEHGREPKGRRPTRTAALNLPARALAELAAAVVIGYTGQRNLARARMAFDAARESARPVIGQARGAIEAPVS